MHANSSSAVLLVALALVGGNPAAGKTLGVFSQSVDVGAPSRIGSAGHAAGVYSVTGGGENMWFGSDAFHFVYTEVEGDVTLAADIEWVGSGAHEHRKACLMIRAGLGADAPYADAALHGDGLTALQYRSTPGADTQQLVSSVTGPRRLRIEKRGRYVTMSVAAEGDALEPASGSLRMDFDGPLYVGLAVCSHDDSKLETAKFSRVELNTGPDDPGERTELVSTLETVEIASGNRQVVLCQRAHFEAPNWSPDGESLVYNQEGKLYRLGLAGGDPEVIDTGFAVRCNNDHGISPDGTQLVISDQTHDDWRSRIYVLPVGGVTAGEEPRLVTEAAPSYWHGWSPDGKTLAYCAERDGEYDVYAIPVAGGEETRLTDAPGLDDGPDYSPDGRYLYFNSFRTGTMQLWRIDADGGSPTQLTHDRRQNWFPHPSPDGRWLVYVSYEPQVEGHPANQDVELRLIPAGGGEPRTLAKLFGGQGTINVPSWSPDSRSVAFVSYQLVGESE